MKFHKFMKTLEQSNSVFGHLFKGGGHRLPANRPLLNKKRAENLYNNDNVNDNNSVGRVGKARLQQSASTHALAREKETFNINVVGEGT